MTDNVITTRTPLRISIAGGNTDSPVYFERRGGLVVSLTIDQFVVVNIHKGGDKPTDAWTQQHLKAVGLEDADISVSSVNPLNGKSGLGMSSAYSVGLFKALFAYKGESKSPAEIAALACELNMATHGRDGVGFQDEYACAHPGLNAITFERGNAITVEPFSHELGHELADMLMLFKTSIYAKDSGQMMRSVNSDDRLTTNHIRDCIKGVAEITMGRLRTNNINPRVIGDILQQGWEYKRLLSPQMCNPEIDEAYRLAKEAGATGGKVCGSGGGGYLLVCCDPGNRHRVRDALSHVPELKFTYAGKGSQ